MKSPTTLAELIAARPGTSVCDMHDGLPAELATHPRVYCPVPIEVIDTLLCQSHVEYPEDGMSTPLVRSMANKIAYKVASANGLTTLAYIYDDRGWFLTIEH